MSFQTTKPALIEYLINMTGCPVSPSQLAKHMGMSHNTIRRYLKELVDCGEVDRVERILLPDNKIISTGQMYYVNDLDIITRENAKYHIKQYQRFKEYCKYYQLYYGVKEIYIKRKDFTQHCMIDVGLVRVGLQVRYK